MPEDKHCKLLQTPSSSDKKKKKKKKKKKAFASSTPPENTERPQAVSLPPETMPVSMLPPQSPHQPPGRPPKVRAAGKKGGERLASSGRRSRRPVKDSPALLAATNKTAAGRGSTAELSIQARESLRWEGVLEDPQAEEKRMELYKANRRQRYVSHREALLKATQDGLRQTFSKQSKEKKASE